MIGAQNLVYANPMGPYAEDPRQAELRRILERMRGTNNQVELVESPMQRLTTNPMDALGDATMASAGAPAVAAPPAPADPLELEIPNAPVPVDVAGIRKEEHDALEQERGPRIKKNPKGLKGFLLGLAKGAVGLAEGYGRSGARDWMDALPSMVQGASGRIDQYTTNREDYEPFDQELTGRVRQRVEPLLQKYGQDRQAYGDRMDRYGVERKNRDDADARGFRDRQFNALDESRKRDDARLERSQAETERRNRDLFTKEMSRIQSQTQIGLARLKDARVKGVVQAQTKELDKRVAALTTTERDLLAQRRALQSQLGRGYGIYGSEKPAVNDPKVTAARQRISEIEDELEDLQSDKNDIFERYATIAQEFAGAGSGAATAKKPMTAADALAIIDRREKDETYTPAVAAEKRAQVRARAGGQ